MANQKSEASSHFSFDSFIQETRLQADLLASNWQAVESKIRELQKGLRSTNQNEMNLLTNSQLEMLFGASTAAAFTLWQHLSAVERLADAEEWQRANPKTWSHLSQGVELCGLAVTHLAKPGGSTIRGSEADDGFVVSGYAPWVCGFRIFDHLVVGFETETSVIVALIEFPKVSSEEMSIRPLALASLNGTSTVQVEFKNKRIPMSTIISRRTKTLQGGPKVRPSRYVMPELGIAKAGVAEIAQLTQNSSHPRHALVKPLIPQLEDRIEELSNMRSQGSPDEVLIPIRDELNRDVIRILALATGADALRQGSLVSRLQLEVLLLDCVIQSPATLQNKLSRMANASDRASGK